MNEYGSIITRPDVTAECVFDPDEEERYHDELVARRAISPNGRRIAWSASELMATEFPAIKWAVDGVLAEGLNLLAGSPKVGKSWLTLGIAVAVGSGGRAIGKVEVERGEVLYLALEDPPRRLKRRLELMLGDEPAPAGLDFWTACSRLPDGADEIRRWLDQHPAARLVVVDVFAKLKAPSDARTGAYEADYASTLELKRIADEYGVCVVMVHHTRKATADDWTDSISGTNGLAGGADGLLVLRRQRGAAAAELLVTGRDVEESTHALSFAPDLGAWSLLDGPAEDYTLGETRRAVLHLLREQEGLTPKAIAEKLELDHQLVKKTVQRMLSDEQLDTDGAGHYFPLSLQSPLSPERDTGDARDTPTH